MLPYVFTSCISCFIPDFLLYQLLVPKAAAEIDPWGNPYWKQLSVMDGKRAISKKEANEFQAEGYGLNIYFWRKYIILLEYQIYPPLP